MLRIALLISLGLASALPANAQDRPGDAWWQTDAVRRCCGLGDAVWSDVWSIEGDNIRATVTGGGPREHAWAPIGREYVVPKDKWLDEPGNPTGRPMLFINPHNLDHVFCMALGPMI